MNGARGRIVITSAVAGAPDGWARSVLAELGLGPGDERSWRRLGPRMLVAWGDRLTDAALLRASQVQGIRRALVMEDGERLVERWPIDTPSRGELVPGLRRGDQCTVIAGPCSVESAAHLLDVAGAVAEAGADAIRAGLFKPRTSPYSFGGLGEAGLGALDRARERTGLPVVTEVLDRELLDIVAAHADLLQIGSRNMFNTALLFEAGAHTSGKPVLLKRGFGATVDELLNAAEYVLLGRLAGGHDEPRLVLCERGIRSFEPSSRFTLDLAAVPVLRRRTHLPVIVDPSHAAGTRGLVIPLALAAIGAGAEGLLLEVHPDPPRAWSDAAHAIGYDTFRQLMERVRG